jgi:dihydrofolate synthase/folylpolyglutamate synthase
MTYPEAIQFLYRLQMFGAKFGLETTFELAARIGNPQQNLRFIHVAGTNGKGSTCAMLESIYRAAGLRTGLFTSPHLVSFRERIQVNRQLIPEADLVRLVGELRAATGDLETTLFEFATVMALKFFAEQNCDVIIWETGLGGRLDATNIVTPLAGVITNIAFDHQQWLGDTLEKIAAEKAGIIKPGIPVITATEDAPALAVIKSTAQEKRSPFVSIGKEVIAEFAYPTALLGAHQKINAVLAVATVNLLRSKIPVNDAQVREGLAQVQWPGRLQLIQTPGGQRILLDGAHNLAGAAALQEALRRDFAGTPPVLIFGALADKQWSDICRTLAPVAKKVFTVPVASPRTADATELAAVFRSTHPAAAVEAKTSLKEALEVNRSEPFILITGSLYLIGEALELLGAAPSDTAGRALNEWVKVR